MNCWFIKSAAASGLGPAQIIVVSSTYYNNKLSHTVEGNVFVYVIGWQAVVFGINSASIVNRKE